MDGRAKMGHSVMVSCHVKHADQSPIATQPKQVPVDTAKQTRSQSSTCKETSFTGSSFVRDSIKTLNLPAETAEIVMQSCRASTRGRYDSIMREWGTFCAERKIDSVCPTINDILAFFTHLYGQGKEYNTIVMMKSVLSSIIHVPGVGIISQYPLVKRLLKGVFNSRPPKSKYECIWDQPPVIT